MSGVARSGGGLFRRAFDGDGFWNALWSPNSAYPALKTERLLIRPPQKSDHVAWARLRRASAASLKPWEPSWSSDHLSAAAFRRRVRWSQREIDAGRAYPLLIFERDPRAGPRLVGGLTLEHVRHGAAMSASLGYWLGVGAEGRGLMAETIEAVAAFAFDDLDLSRLEAACLPENTRSRRLLERAGFHEEGFASAYLRIDGAWRDHVLYERRRQDRIDPAAREA
ncbi:MAG: GNAT family protein [Pseudomonadota bacterium]